jgi:hypothetical protein
MVFAINGNEHQNEMQNCKQSIEKYVTVVFSFQAYPTRVFIGIAVCVALIAKCDDGWW